MGGAMMIFTAGDGKTYYPVRLKPPEKIRCHLCDKDMKRSQWILPMNPEIYQYACECKAKARISATDTIEHWPDAIQDEYKASMKRWFEDGMPVKEVLGACVYNPLAIEKINLDGGGDGGKEKEEVQEESRTEEEGGGGGEAHD